MLLIGILSDSHGRHLMVRRAMALFDDLGVGPIFHCGDVGGMAVFDELVGRDCTFVWGNTDDPDSGLQAYVRSVGLIAPTTTPTLREIDGKRIAVFHGHEPSFGRIERSLDVDYVFHGHTHVARDERIGGARIINPGALHRAARTTVATLEIDSDTLSFHDIIEEC